MARKVSTSNDTKVAAPSQNSQPTAAEVREWYEKNKNNFAVASDALKQLRDVTKITGNRTISAFNKESLRGYLQNIASNEQNLRNLSRYLFYRCHAYYRLILYNATMFCLDARAVIPSYDLTKNNDKKKILKSYNTTLHILENMNLQYEFLKVYVTNFREDVYYGCCYYDDTGMFFLPLDPDYCRISGIYQTGDFAFSMDMTYFRSRQDMLEFLGEPFQSMWDAYQAGGNSARWQPMPDEYCVCLKARPEDWETAIPVFSGLLNSIINLIDLEDIQAVADAQEIYKMIWMELETITGTNNVDDWKVNPSLVIDYFNRMIDEALPDYISAAIIPGKLNTITFDNDKATDTNKISKSTETLFNSSGGAQILNSSTISGSTAFNAAVKADTEFAISFLLPQTQAWVNRFLSYQISNPSKVKFFEVSTYTLDGFKESILKDAQHGLPVKLILGSLEGLSALDVMSLNYLEEECLDISEKFIPLSSSYTQSSSSPEGGAPTKSDTGISDDGEASRDKADAAN